MGDRRGLPSHSIATADPLPVTRGADPAPPDPAPGSDRQTPRTRKPLRVRFAAAFPPARAPARPATPERVHRPPPAVCGGGPIAHGTSPPMRENPPTMDHPPARP